MRRQVKICGVRNIRVGALTLKCERIHSYRWSFEQRVASAQEDRHRRHLVVTVDDVEIPNDAVDGWTYDSENWLIRFDGDYVPERGSTIHANYEIGGG